MAYPKIFPVEPGRDGWKPIFDTAVSRLLFHCGLLPVSLKVQPGAPSKIQWASPSKPVASWVRSEETRPLPVTLEAMKKALGRVYRMHGTAEVRDILKIHGNAAHPDRVKRGDYRHVYIACMAALDRRNA